MDFGSMFQTWVNVLIRPGEATFTEESQKPYASLSTAIIWIIIAALISAVFGAIGAAISGMLGGGMAGMQSLLSEADLPPEVRAQLATMLAGTGGGGALGVFCFTLIFAPLGFLIGSGIYFVVAKLFGGVGSFEEQSYLLSTFTAPLMIVTGALNMIPFLGGCLAFFVSIYQLVLAYFAIKVSHSLTSGKAVAVILIPVLLIFLCAICGVAVAFMGLAAALSEPQFGPVQ